MSVKRRKRIQKIGLEKMPEGIGQCRIVLTEWTSHGDGPELSSPCASFAELQSRIVGLREDLVKIETECGFVNGIVPS